MECDVVIRDLGVYLDSELSMKHHVNKIPGALASTTSGDCARFATMSADKS